MAIFANLIGRLSLDSTAFDRNSRRASQSMYHMRRRSLALQGTIIKLGAAFFAARGVIRGLSATTREAASFSLGMARIHTMLDEGTSRYLPRYREEIQKLAIEFGESTQSLQDATYDILSGSIAAGNAMKFLRANVIAARGGFTSTAISTKAAVGILNAYGMKARQVTRINDILAMTVKRGVITYEQLASEIGKVTSLAAILKVDFEAVTASIATFTRAGMSAELSTTALKNILNIFKTPTKEARQAAEDLGFELDANSIKGRGLINVMDKLKNANAYHLKALMPNIRGLVGFASGLKNASGLAADYELMIDSAGRSLETFGKVQDEASVAIDKMKERHKLYKRELITAIIPALQDLMDVSESWHEENIRFINEQVQGLAEILSGFESLRTVVKETTNNYAILRKVASWTPIGMALKIGSAVKQRDALPQGKLDIPPRRAQHLAEMRARARRLQSMREGTESWLEEPSGFTGTMRETSETIVEDTKEATVDVAAAYRRMFNDMDKNTQESWDVRERLLMDEFDTYKKVIEDKALLSKWFEEQQKKFQQERAIAMGNIAEGFSARVSQMRDELQTIGELGAGLADTLRDGLVNSLTDAVFEAQNLGDALREVGLSMAKMAMQWAMQQAVTAGLSALTGIVAHGGTTVGGGMQVKRSLPGAEFISAQRFHGGGEVPAWLQPGERVQSRQQVAGGDRLQGEMVSLLRQLVAKNTAPTVAVVQSEEQILDVMRSRAGEEAISRARQRME